MTAHDYVLLIANLSLVDCNYIMMKILAVYWCNLINQTKRLYKDISIY